MGYFSELDLEMQMPSVKPQPTRRQRLEQRLEYLKEELAELEEIRPHDPLDPLFDRYFYADNTEELSSCQGILRAIRSVEAELQQIQDEQEEALRWWNAVLVSGETPEGQTVLTDMIYPQFGAWVAA